MSCCACTGAVPVKGYVPSIQSKTKTNKQAIIVFSTRHICKHAKRRSEIPRYIRLQNARLQIFTTKHALRSRQTLQSRHSTKFLTSRWIKRTSTTLAPVPPNLLTFPFFPTYISGTVSNGTSSSSSSSRAGDKYKL